MHIGLNISNETVKIKFKTFLFSYNKYKILVKGINMNNHGYNLYFKHKWLFIFVTVDYLYIHFDIQYIVIFLKFERKKNMFLLLEYF